MLMSQVQVPVPPPSLKARSVKTVGFFFFHSGMPLINLSVISANPLFLKLIFNDCILSMRRSLEQLGHKVYVTENTWVKGAVNILWGLGSNYAKDYALYADMMNSHPSLIMNMEQLSGGSQLLDAGYFDLLRGQMTLDYCEVNTQFLRDEMGYSMPSMEFPLLPIELSYVYESAQKNYDFAFFGAMNQRREKMIQNLNDAGLSVKVINGRYGDDLSEAVADCRALLNVHYYDSGLFEVARCIRPVSMHVPIFSEASVFPSHVDWTEAGIEFADYAQMTSRAFDFLKPDNLHALSLKSKKFCSQYENMDACKNFVAGWPLLLERLQQPRSAGAA